MDFFRGITLWHLRYLVFFLIFTFVPALANEKVYKVVILENEKPYYFINNQNKPDGYAVELFKKVAQSSGISYEFVVAKHFDHAYELVKKNQADIIPNIAIRQSKEQLFIFTQPTDQCPIGIYHKRSHQKISQIEDLANKRIGVLKNHYCEEIKTDDQFEIGYSYETFEEAAAAIYSGDIDLLIHSQITGLEHVSQLQNYELVQSPLQLPSYRRGIGIAKESFELLPLFDDAITDLQIEGTLTKLHQYWFDKKRFAFTFKEIAIIVSLIFVLFIALFISFIFISVKSRWLNTKNKLEEEIKNKTAQLIKRNKEIKDVQNRLYLVMDNMNDLLFYKDKNLCYLGCNEQFCKYVGKPKEAIIGKDDFALFDSEVAKVIVASDKEVLQNRQKRLRGDWISFKNVGDVYIQASLSPFYYDEDALGIIGVLRDNTKLHLAQKKIQSQRYIDELTQANNRKSYNKRVEEFLYRYKRYKTPFCFLIYDIDNFKDINDTYGHKIGDEVLIKMTQIVQDEIRKSDQLFRIGGEEFVVLLDNTTLQEAAIVAHKIKESISQDLDAIEKRVITVSIGLTQVRQDDVEQTIFKRADKLLYRAKQNGKNRVITQ